MKTLIKLGGTLLDHPDKLSSIARQIADQSRRHELVIVHGGGKQVTRFMEERGIESRFIGGLRVSDAPVIDAVVKVIAGTVNKNLVSALIAAGRNAVGLSGIDGQLTQATPMRPELESVGKPGATDGKLLQLLIDAGYLPVIACLAGDSHGNIFNVNADAMAVSCAIGWPAERLLFLTDVPGVRGRDGDVLCSLSPAVIRELIAEGVAHGGMQAKLESASQAAEAGLRVTVALGSEPNVCSRLLNGEPIGTEIHGEAIH